MGIYIEYDKPFKTYDEQIEHLKTNLNLKIYNEDFAREVLSTISYYDLINGYQEYAMSNGKFKEGISLEYLAHFYIFDRCIQNVMLQNSLLVENIFKTKLSYVLAKNFGVDMYDYLDKKHFKNNGRRNIFFHKVKKEILERIEKFDPQPTKHYKEKHNHVPPWILLRNVEFGNAINLYRLLKKEAKAELAESLISGSVDVDSKIQFTISALSLVKEYRNRIAHNLKFVTYKSSKNKLPYKTTLKIIDNSVITDNIQSFDNIYAYMLSILLLLQTQLLRARFCYDLTNPMIETHQCERSPVQDKIVDDYVQVAELPIDFTSRLNEILKLKTV